MQTSQKMIPGCMAPGNKPVKNTKCPGPRTKSPGPGQNSKTRLHVIFQDQMLKLANTGKLQAGQKPIQRLSWNHQLPATIPGYLH